MVGVQETIRDRSNVDSICVSESAASTTALHHEAASKDEVRK